MGDAAPPALERPPESPTTFSVSPPDRRLRIRRWALWTSFQGWLLIGLIGWYVVGGAGHLDMMAWYWKLLLPLGLAFAATRVVAIALESASPWTPKSVLWMCAVIAVLLAMGLVTLYYHQQELLDEDLQEEAQATVHSMRWRHFR
jgi:hypothetical protein